MNDTELFELCNEVYEKTGWDSTEKCYAYLKNLYFDVWDWNVMPLNEDNVDDVDEWHPLYTSDYLLDKLPKYVTVKKTEYLLVLIPFPDGWIADYYRRYRPLDEFDSSDRLSWLHNAEKAQLCEADTPLNSLLKLTLALHKAGEL